MNTIPTVVVVDDDEDSLQIFAAVLSRRGYHPVPVTDGKAGLDIIRRIVPDLVVTDYQIPRFDGCELVEALSRDPATARIPTILVTADARPEVRTRAAQAGCTDLLLKPTDPFTLTERIRELLHPDRALAEVG